MVVMASPLLDHYWCGPEYDDFQKDCMNAQLQFVIILAFTVIPVDFIRKAAVGSLHRGNAI